MKRCARRLQVSPAELNRTAGISRLPLRLSQEMRLQEK